MVLEDPPLNLFGRAAFESLTRCIAEVEVSTRGRWCGGPRATSSPAAWMYTS
jgi:hypothetical protein